MRYWKTYITFIIITFAIGYMSGVMFPPGVWYAGLEKPWFNPPDWVFPVVWSLLYIMIGLAGAKAWLDGLTGLPFLLWIAQLGLNGLWSYLFFGLQSPVLALMELFVLLVVIIAFIRTTWHSSRLASLLFLPYAGWVFFAGILNAAIWVLNG